MNDNGTYTDSNQLRLYCGVVFVEQDRAMVEVSSLTPIHYKITYIHPCPESLN
jgi:hypothetical protein